MPDAICQCQDLRDRRHSHLSDQTPTSLNVDSLGGEREKIPVGASWRFLVAEIGINAAVDPVSL